MYWILGIGAFFFIMSISILFDDFGTGLAGIAIGAALLTIGVFMFKKQKPQFFHLIKQKKFLEAIKSLSERNPGERKLTVESFRAVGVSYYEKNIQKLAYQNPGWDQSAKAIVENGDVGRRIFRYNYGNKPVKLVAENNNPNDKNAVAIYIAGELVGYISKEENTHVRDILKNREIKSLSGFIGGGQYKVISDNQEIVSAETDFSVNIRIKYI